MVELLGHANLQITPNDDHTEAYRIKRDGPGVFYINTIMQTGMIVSVTLMEKDPNHSDYIISGKQMEVGLLCSDEPNTILAQTRLSDYCHEPTSFILNTDFYKMFLRSLAVRQSIGLMIDDHNTLHAFVNGVHAEVFRSPQFVGGKFRFMGNAAGRSRRIKIEIFNQTDMTSIRLICLRTCKVKNEDKSEDLKYGTAVKVQCYKECNDVSKLTKIWIKVDKDIHKNIDTEGQVRSKYLRIMPQDINPADFNSIVRDSIKERVSGQYSIIRILCVGPPNVGKTSLKHVLQGKAPPSRYQSTHVTDKTNRIHRASLVPHQSGSAPSSNTDWVDFGFDQHVKQLSSIVAHKRHSMPISSSKQKEDSLRISIDGNSSSSDVQLDNPPPPSPHQTPPLSPETLAAPESDDEYDDVFQDDKGKLLSSLRNATACRDIKKRDFEDMFEHIFFTDCGGQPQFLEVLPAFIKGGTVVIMVMNLNEDIKKVPRFSYHIDNKDTSMSGNYSSLTTLEMIETIAHSIAAYKRDDLDVSDPYYMIVATHIDKVKFGMHKKILEVNKILDEALVDTRVKCIELEELNRAIIFPINAIQDTEKMGETIRERIKQKVAGKTISIPIRWHSFEIHILAYSEKMRRKILTVQECVEVASSKEVCIPEEEVWDVLNHYSEVNTLLYFPTFLPDFVITDPQILLEIVSCLLTVSFVKASNLPALPPGSQVQLKEKGIFTKETINICTNTILTNEAPPSFNINHVTALLSKLNLIARINNDEFFMPSALQVCDEKNFLKLRLKYTNHFDPLILLPQSKLLPHGLFTSLSACLLNRERPPRFECIDTQQFRNVIMMRYTSRMGGGGSVLLSHMKYWLEVCYSGDTPHDAYLIQNIIFDILPDVCENLPYDHRKICFSHGFYCMLASKRKDHRRPHPCKVDSFNPQPSAPTLAVTCTLDPSLTSSKQGHDTRKTSWLLVQDPLIDADLDLLQSLHVPASSVADKSPQTVAANDSNIDSQKPIEIVERANLESRNVKPKQPAQVRNETMHNGVRENRKVFNQVNGALKETNRKETVPFPSGKQDQQTKQSNSHDSDTSGTKDEVLHDGIPNNTAHTDASSDKYKEFVTSTCTLPPPSADTIMQELQDLKRNYQMLQTQYKQLEISHSIKAKELAKLQAHQYNAETERSWEISYKDIEVTDEELGKGGWGFIRVGIFHAQRVAVKQLYSNIIHRNTIEIFRREINTMAKLRHPNLVLFIGAVFDHQSGSPLLIMEKMDKSLKQAYEDNSFRKNNKGKLLVLRDVAAALCYLHGHKEEIIHRDVSSNNVLLELKGENYWKAKLSDFGCARIVQKAQTHGVGTAVYSAPETMTSVIDSDVRPWTTKADVFSYGVLVCEVFCERFPDVDFGQMRKELLNDYHPIGELVESCIQRDPTQRPTMINIINNNLDIYNI